MQIAGDRDLQFFCSALIDEVAKRVAHDQFEKWTYRTFSKWLNLPAGDARLLTCVQILSTAQAAKLLDLHFMFFDPADPDDIGTPLEDEDISQAFAAGFLVHPETGKKVENFRACLEPYFSLDQAAEVSW